MSAMGENGWIQRFGLFIILAVVLLISIIAIIVAAVSISKSNDKDDKLTFKNLDDVRARAQAAAAAMAGKDDKMVRGLTLKLPKFYWDRPPPPGTLDRIWMIALGHDYGAYEYISDEGYLSGFSRLMIQAVCKAGGKICRMLWEPYTNCWDAEPGQHSFGGPGLMDGWYDACTAWSKSVNRIHVFDFSKSYMKKREAVFWAKAGQEGRFDTNRPKSNNVKIGFLDGWVNDEKCLAKFGPEYKIELRNIVHYTTIAEMAKAISNGEVAAGWAGSIEMKAHEKSDDNPNPDYPIKIVPNFRKSCVMDGGAMMTRKDSEFNAWWNNAFDSIVSNGVFRKICQTAAVDHKHKGLVNCIDT